MTNFDHTDTHAGILNPRFAYVQDDAGRWLEVTESYAYRGKVAGRYEWCYSLHTAAGVIQLAEHELEIRTRSAKRQAA